MSYLNVPAKVSGTAELDEMMHRIAGELRLVASQAEQLRKQVRKELCETLVAEGVATATAESLASQLAHDLHSLDIALNTAASEAGGVSQTIGMIRNTAKNARSARAAALS